MFRNEHIMYTEILPKMSELEIVAEVPLKERLRYAACYGSSKEAPNEVILLEDLKESSFVMLDRFKPISSDCVKSVLKNFALYHSLSFALKNKEPELFEKFKNSLFDIWEHMDGQESSVQYFTFVENNSCDVVDSDFYRKAIKGSVLEASKKLAKMARHEKDNKYNVIQQGDAWTNNIMFKFNGETLLESIMIDYQVSKPANPVMDILYLIFNCTNYEMRKKLFYDWIDYYHCELDKSLENYGLKAAFVFSRDQLDSDLRRYGKVNLGLTILLAKVLTTNTEEAAQMKKKLDELDGPMILEEEAFACTDDETRAILKTRLQDLVNSYYEFGLI